jgi:2-oxoisovalerate dehydrogenase E1 component beta subunit
MAEKEGVSCEIIDLQTIYPYDACIVAHEAPISGGMGAEISAKIQ